MLLSSCSACSLSRGDLAGTQVASQSTHLSARPNMTDVPWRWILVDACGWAVKSEHDRCSVEMDFGGCVRLGGEACEPVWR
jgi:hypothetical protein